MKILFIHKSVLGAFGEAAIHYYPKCLACLGHEVWMVAKAGGSADFLTSHGVQVVEVELGGSWLETIGKTMAKLQPDLVHVFLYSGCGLVPLMTRNVQARTKYVMDIRSPLLRTGIARLLHRIKNIFEPIFFDTVVSHGIESGWTQIGKRREIHWLPPGVDFSMIESTRDVVVNERDDPSFRLVYIGSLDAIRKIDVMLEAVLQAVPHVDISLDIYGDGNQRNQLEAKVKMHELGYKISFKGRVTRDEILKKLSSYDVGLSYIPYGIYDSAPALKTLEYLACGIPVLATNTFGNRMYVENGVNGFLVGELTDDYAKAIVQLVSFGELQKLRERALPSVETYDWERIVQERLLPRYHELVK